MTKQPKKETPKPEPKFTTKEPWLPKACACMGKAGAKLGKSYIQDGIYKAPEGAAVSMAMGLEQGYCPPAVLHMSARVFATMILLTHKAAPKEAKLSDVEAEAIALVEIALQQLEVEIAELPDFSAEPTHRSLFGDPGYVFRMHPQRIPKGDT